MSWGLGWKRPSEGFRLTLTYGTDDPSSLESANRTSVSSVSSSSSNSSLNSMSPRETDLVNRIDLEWTAGDDEDQVALKLQSQLMVAMPMPQDTVVLELNHRENESVGVEMKVVRRREPLKAVVMSKTTVSGQQSDGIGVLTRLLRWNFADSATSGEASVACGEHWRTVTAIDLSNCCLSVSVHVTLSD